MSELSGPVTPSWADARHPRDRRARLIRLIPFGLVGFLVLPGALLAPPTIPEAFLAGVALAVVVLVVGIALPTPGRAVWTDAVPPIGFIVAVGLLRHGTGGAASGVSPLVLVGLLWLCLYGTWRQILAAQAVIAVVLIAPMLVVGPPLYPASELRRIVAILAFGALLAFTIRQLNDEVHAAFNRILRARRASEDSARQHLDDLAKLLAVARDLGRPTSARDGRDAICEAAVELADADMALFFEARPEEDALVATGSAGQRIALDRIALDPRHSMTAQIVHSARPTFVGDLLEDDRVDRQTAITLNVRAAFWQPVLRDSKPIGVLVVYWGAPRRPLGFRVESLLELFATQAAVVVERADLMGRLEALARTDPLTTIANRRALEEALVRELASAERSGRPLSVVMLDLDHFKEFNDRRGHQSGDVHLRDTAAAWLRELRPSDTLARFGGEEFLAILPDCESAVGARIGDRLRELVPGRETCSAGVATWDRRETMTDLIARADAALYEAKRRGRDRTVVAEAAAAAGALDQTAAAARRRTRNTNLRAV
jgi:diguanylate cyclase (GGDEF)-like protein